MKLLIQLGKKSSTKLACSIINKLGRNVDWEFKIINEREYVSLPILDYIKLSNSFRDVDSKYILFLKNFNEDLKEISSDFLTVSDINKNEGDYVLSVKLDGLDNSFAIGGDYSIIRYLNVHYQDHFGKYFEVVSDFSGSGVYAQRFELFDPELMRYGGLSKKLCKLIKDFDLYRDFPKSEIESINFELRND